MGTLTSEIELYKPAFNETGWDDEINDNFDKIDHYLGEAWSEAVLYVDPVNGDNANDGKSWASPKKDIGGAYDALPTLGGRIECKTGSFVNANDPTQGLWIVGPNDPAFNGGNPTVPGWRPQKRVHLKGVGPGHSANNHVPNVAVVGGGSGTDRDKPGIWLTGINNPMFFENIQWQYPAVFMRLGIRVDKSEITNTSNIFFRGVGFNLNQVVGNGPGIEMGYCYWVWFKDCMFAGNTAKYTLTSATRSGTTATFTTSVNHFLNVGDTVEAENVSVGGYNGLWTVTSVPAGNQFTATLPADPGANGTGGTAEPVDSYRRAAIGHWAGLYGSIGSGLITIKDSVFNGGGFYYRPNGTTSWGRVTLSNITHEGDFVGPEPPTFSLHTVNYGDLALPGFGVGIYIRDVELADSDFTTAVKVEGILSSPDIVTVVNATVEGNATVLNAPSGSHPVRPNRGVGTANARLLGPHDAGRRLGGVVTVQHANLARYDIDAAGLGGAVITPNIADPFGGTDAVRLVGQGGGSEDREVFRGSRTVATGDWIIAGVWMRYHSGSTGGGGATSGIVSMVSGDGLQRFEGGPGAFFIFDDGSWFDDAWYWAAQARRISPGSATPIELVFSVRTALTREIDYFAPLLLHIPAAQAGSRTEMLELARHSGTWPQGAPKGAVTTQANQLLIARGGLGVGNDVAATTLGSVVKKVEIFDETGASIGFLPVYNSIT